MKTNQINYEIPKELFKNIDKAIESFEEKDYAAMLNNINDDEKILKAIDEEPAKIMLYEYWYEPLNVYLNLFEKSKTDEVPVLKEGIDANIVYENMLEILAYARDAIDCLINNEEE